MKTKMNIKSIFVMAIISLASLLFINISLAANTGTINVDVANLRETADAESKILEQISLNQEVEILGEEGDWYKITHNQITGYVNKELVTVNSNPEPTEDNNQLNENSTTENNQVNENTTEESNTTSTENTNDIELGEYKIAENTKLKLIPSINATDVIELKADETVQVTEIINGWVCVETQTAKGWLRKEKIKKDETVQVTEIINGWVCVETQTAKGWLRKEKIKKDEPVQEEQQVVQEPVQETPIKTQYTNSTTVNVRQEENTTSSILTTIALNTEVQVYSEANGWSKVKVNNVEGYISTSLLSDTKQETSRSEATTRKSSSTKTKSTKTTSAQTTAQATSVPASSNGSSIVATAKQYLGYKYVYGGSSPSTGFDCSGFTSYVFKQHGISLSRTAAGQYGNGVAVSRANLQPGDLVMFGKSGINHVAIYIGGGQIIHASTPSTGVRIDSLTTGYYNNNYAGARRIL